MTEIARSVIEQQWLDLTRIRLPKRAIEARWSLRLDHCFQRILLDDACGGCWYDHIVGRPAYANAPDAVLARAIATGEALLAGTADLIALNAQSLAWRGKGGKLTRSEH
ncbi:GCN5-related N-acetyltransferase [Sphingomonas sp. PAMC 26621]|uniref:GCN5-related N-acetyltransferase n=1 Tax=Sphingomonas sp. PAMC 26621 TaxID=1112213 RepID=UPI001EE63C89|nr:GCN5-related N-acetyltransferase [Sphingomonas sp. PAMC 26621]